MKAIHALYTHEVYAHLRPLHANWEPTQALKLGDVGYLDGRTFRQETSLGDLGIGFSTRVNRATANQVFASNGNADIVLKPEIRTTLGQIEQRASLEVSFSSKGATFLHVAQCESVTVSDKAKLGKKVLEAFNQRRWNPKWVVVTTAINSEATTLAIAGAKGAKLCLEAVGHPSIDLNETSIRFEAKSQRQVGYQLVSEKGLTPLIALSMLTRPWFGGPQFQPALAGASGKEESWRFLDIL
jgi:hypothetical protein